MTPAAEARLARWRNALEHTMTEARIRDELQQPNSSGAATGNKLLVKTCTRAETFRPRREASETEDSLRSAYHGIRLRRVHRGKFAPDRISAGSASSRSAVSFSCLVAVPAKDGPVATRFKRHGCGLSATRTNHRSSLCRTGTVACPSPLIAFSGLPARLATFWGRITAFLKERLIRSGEGEVTPAVAALKLNISRHGNPRGEIVQPKVCFSSRNLNK
jgi:hypothetical protein